MIGPDQAITVNEAPILEADPFKTHPDQISAIKVSETWVAGEKASG